MEQKYYIGLTTECEGGQFLAVGHNIGADYTAVFLLPEKHHEDVSWGRIARVDLSGPKKKIDGDWFPCATLLGVLPDLPRRHAAAEYQESVNAFLEQKGWVEQKSADLAETVQTMQAYFNMFPD